ncbi:MAG: DNA repair exonuclease [Chloroflexi bacterium]|nr:DNA repair exonuclease [Chloroflexota bacterium]MBT4515623.1 DNA repair exonuclease [Chloroflexota bacterium]MBT5318531.1 DNA repair exonuclease [Chloroflexota bacterium]MBT6680535.1 DNA repair exonuclease [Chloroflexota bacterium]
MRCYNPPTMQPFRFVHAADLHIDSPFKGLLKYEPRIAQRLKDATYEAYSNLIDLCIAQDAAFVVIAGDVYDGADRSVQAQMRFRDGLNRLQDHEIQSFVVHGNHDPLDGRLSRIPMPESSHAFGPDPEWSTASVKGTPVAQIQGVSYPTREVHDNLALQFTPPSGALFSIGLLHCNVGGIAEHDNYAPCTVDDLSATGIDYWALGHVHTRQTLRQSGPAIEYPGNLQGRHPNESGPKGALVVDVDEAGRVTSRFEPLDVVRWESLDVSINGLADVDALLESAHAAIETERIRADERDLVCRISFTGRGPLHHDLSADNALEDLTNELRSNLSASASLIWVERISDRTAPTVDIDALTDRDDFVGAVMKRSLAALNHEGSEATLRESLASVLGQRRFSGVLEMPEDDQMAEIVEAARFELAELFERED